MSEVWKPIPGYENLYEVSANGRVRSKRRTVTYINRWGTETTYTRESAEMHPWATKAGHLFVALRSADGVKDSFGVHRLVLMAFVGPAPEGMFGCHNDGDPANNSVANLRWDTPKGNSQDMLKHGTATRGVRQPGAKLREEDIPAIRSRCHAGEHPRDIARSYGVSRSTIDLVVKGRLWSWVA